MAEPGRASEVARSEPAGDRAPFVVFGVLYVTALVVEIAEDWNHPVVIVGLVSAALVLVVSGLTMARFAAVLGASTLYFLIGPFPDVANHVNLMVIINLALLVALAHGIAATRRRLTEADYYARVLPVLRLSLILMYGLAGFHKLNGDYFDEDVSCASDIFSRVVSLVRARILGIPLVLLVGAMAVVIVVRLARSRPVAPLTPGLRVGVGVAAGVVSVAAAAVVYQSVVGAPPTIRTVVGVGLGLGVVLWELAGGLLLPVRRLQAPVLAISLCGHATLAMVSFVDFGVLAVALLFTFVPAAPLRLLTSDEGVAVGPVRLARPVVFHLVNIGAVALWAIDEFVVGIGGMTVLAGLLFNGALLVLIWPFLRPLVGPTDRPAWDGVPVLTPQVPRFLLLVPVLVLVYGMSPYLGLRTAGVFSMFSNLRTEGPGSNHFVLRGDHLQIWDFQDDVVRIIAVDDAHGEFIHHWDDSARGYELPVVEFRKWIGEWEAADRVVPMTFEYEGRTIRTENIVEDSEWGAGGTWWQLSLLDFRVIQTDGPNRCRW